MSRRTRTSDEAPPSPARAVLGGAVALAVALGIGRFAYTPILPAMAGALGLSQSSAGLIASANFLGYLAGAILAASPVLPGTRRLWLLTGLGGSALTTLLMAVARTPTAFLLLRFAGGAASALVLIFASAMVLELLARRRKTGLSAVLFAGVGAGIAVSAILISALGRAGLDWSALWLGCGLLAAAGAALAAALIPAEQTAIAGRLAAGAPAERGDTRRLIVAYGLFGFGYVITATFLVALVRADPRLRELEVVIWLAFGLAAVPSVALWNWLAARVGIARAFALASLAEAAGVALSASGPSRWGLLGAGILVGGTFMGLTSLGLLRGRELARADPRRVMALMTVAFGCGQIVGPVFGGFLFDQLGNFVLPTLVAALALVAAAVLVLI